MKPIEESADEHRDFAGDESTSVMGADLLSSLTERSRRVEVATATIAEPALGTVVDDEVEPVTTVSPAAIPKLLVAAREYPVLGDDESTEMMQEPEPTTVAVRSRRDEAPPPPEPPPAPAFRAQPLPVPSVPDPQWVAELPSRVPPTIVPQSAPSVEATSESTSKPAAGSRRLSAIAAVTLGVAAWTLGLGHHECLPAAAVSPPISSVSSAVIAPSGLRARVEMAVDHVRTAFVSLFQASASVASARNESTTPQRSKHSPATSHRQRS